jgi:hypothetical protein
MSRKVSIGQDDFVAMTHFGKDLQKIRTDAGGYVFKHGILGVCRMIRWNSISGNG